MTYAVKEMFYSLQGEGLHSGRAAVFVRLAGCNGWSGREADREAGPLGCSAWCDTDFVGMDGSHGGKYHAATLASKAASLFEGHRDHRFVVLTGGEPALQVDDLLVDALKRFGFFVQIETNGTRPVPPTVDWITVSPKAGLPLELGGGGELKLVFPQEGIDPERYTQLNFRHWWLQPRDGPDLAANTKEAVDYCLAHPRWKLGLQIHKIVGVR